MWARKSGCPQDFHHEYRLSLGVSWSSTPKDIMEPCYGRARSFISLGRVLHEKFYSVYVVKGVWSLFTHSILNKIYDVKWWYTCVLDRLLLVVLQRFYFELFSHFTNSAFKKLPVKNQEKTIAEDRLIMFHCARLTLGNGLCLLGITPIQTIWGY